MQTDTREWLKTVGLGASKDPIVSLLLDACRVLDEAAAGKDVTPTVANNARAALHKARQSIQRQLEQSNSLVSKHRYEVMFGGLAARTLGYVDVALLTNDTRQIVADELLDVHGITLDPPTETILD